MIHQRIAAERVGIMSPWRARAAALPALIIAALWVARAPDSGRRTCQYTLTRLHGRDLAALTALRRAGPEALRVGASQAVVGAVCRSPQPPMTSSVVLLPRAAKVVVRILLTPC